MWMMLYGWSRCNGPKCEKNTNIKIMEYGWINPCTKDHTSRNRVNFYKKISIQFFLISILMNALIITKLKRSDFFKSNNSNTKKTCFYFIGEVNGSMLDVLKKTKYFVLNSHSQLFWPKKDILHESQYLTLLTRYWTFKVHNWNNGI